MSRMMIQAAVTMNQLQKQLDIIGNNIANVQTPGYKAKNAEFSSLLFQQINNLSNQANQVGRLTPDGIRVGSGARLGDVQMNLSQGSLIESDRPLDTALIDSNTLYEIRVIENNVVETRYTRAGDFYINPINDGQVMLTTSDGHPVIGRDGNPIVFSSEYEEILIESNGTINLLQGSAMIPVGQINVISVVRPGILEAVGSNQFRLPNLAELGMTEAEIIQNTPANSEVLQSNVLEQSNVQLAEELTQLILTQRSYQFNARTISMADQMLGLINQLR